MTTNTPAPAQEAVLTDDEIWSIWVEHGLDDEAIEDFARAIESALLSKLRAPVADERAAFYINPSIIDPATGRIGDHVKSALTWSNTKHHGWQVPVFLSPQQASAPVAGEAQPVELRGVAETIKDGDGFWRSCTGCHELNEGHDTGPYSAVLGCHLGQGCSECGGIGAIWDSSDYQAMADDMARSMGQSVEAAPQASECECARKSKAVSDSEAEL